MSAVVVQGVSKVFTAVFGAAGLGLVMAGLVALLDSLLMRNRPKERIAEALA